MKKIRADISENTFAPAYLLYGDEDFLKLKYRNMLKEAICGDDTMNYSYYQGADIDVQDLVDVSVTMPFFAEHRLIIVEDSKFFKNSSEEVAKAVKNAPDTTIFVFVESEIDKRNKLFKTVSEVGYASEMKTLTQSEIETWALRILKAAGRNITAKDMAYFIGRTGFDMNNVYNELNKLIAYTEGQSVVTRADMDAVGTVILEDHIFDMINAMASKRVDEVMRLYGELLALKESPLKILALIGRQFSQLLTVKDLKVKGAANQEIAQRAGIRPYFVGKYIAQAGNYSEEELKKAVTSCVDAETAIKQGRSDDKYEVELLIIEFSR